MANDTKNKDGVRKFNGLVDVYMKTFKAEGIQGLYRGFVISAVGIFIYRSETRSDRVLYIEIILLKLK